MAERPALVVRVATDEDAPALLEVLRGAERYRRDFSAHASSAAWAESFFEERQIDPEREIYIAFSPERKAVGALEVVRQGDTWTIAQLIVVESGRFLGYGRELFAWLAEEARTQGAAVLSLGVVQRNRGAHAFWQNLGFAKTGRIGSGADTLILMECLLSDYLAGAGVPLSSVQRWDG